MNLIKAFLFEYILLVFIVSLVHADFAFERVKTPCDDPCDQGGCEFVGCRQALVTCNGGACLFRHCTFASCDGGSCIMDNVDQPRCAGGGCDFMNMKKTLPLDACDGENCSLDGVSLPVLHRGQYLTV